MKVLVTGGSGFLGSHLVKELLDKKYKVVAYDRSERNKKNIEEFLDNEGFELMKGDILNFSQLEPAMSDVDLCIHLAARTSVYDSLQNPANYFETNVEGTFNVLEACRLNDVSMIFCSTCNVYDTAVAPINEYYKLKPRSPYSASKLFGENMALAYHYGYGLPVTIIRPFNLYGEKSRGTVVDIFIRNYLTGNILWVNGTGKQTRDLLYVGDCARFFGMVTGALESGSRCDGEVFNIGTGRETSINELAHMICEDEDRIRHREHSHPQSEIFRSCCDFSKAYGVLDWKPEMSLEAGLERTMSWWYRPMTTLEKGEG